MVWHSEERSDEESRPFFSHNVLYAAQGLDPSLRSESSMPVATGTLMDENGVRI